MLLPAAAARVARQEARSRWPHARPDSFGRELDGLLVTAAPDPRGRRPRTVMRGPGPAARISRRPGPRPSCIASLRDETHRVRAWQIVLQILDALAFLHRRGIVHRDVKPENLLLPRVGSQDVKVGLPCVAWRGLFGALSDFCIAHVGTNAPPHSMTLRSVRRSVESRLWAMTDRGILHRLVANGTERRRRTEFATVCGVTSCFDLVCSSMTRVLSSAAA